MGSNSSDLTVHHSQPQAAVTNPYLVEDVEGAQQGPRTIVRKTKMVRNQTNLRKESLKLTRVRRRGDLGSAILPQQDYYIDFSFDSEVPCLVTVYFFATEVLSGSRIDFTPSGIDPSHVLGPVSFSGGNAQKFEHDKLGLPPVSTSSVKVSNYNGQDSRYGMILVLQPDKEKIKAQESTPIDVEFQATYIVLDDKGSTLRPKIVKQKIQTDVGPYTLQEIYGIGGAKAGEGGETDSADKNAVEEGEISGADCVICLTNKRELAILPCRHMCVCRFCASEYLRSQESKCPICRNPAQALLRLTGETVLTPEMLQALQT